MQDAGEVNKRRISILQPESYVAEQFRTLRSRIESMLAAQHAVSHGGDDQRQPGRGQEHGLDQLRRRVRHERGQAGAAHRLRPEAPRPSIVPSVSRPRQGLAEVLLDKASFQDSLIPVEGLNLDVLPVRTQPANPSELLASAAMRRLIEESSAVYDRVILDTPAVLGLPDAKIVSDLCDGYGDGGARGHHPPRRGRGGARDSRPAADVLGLVLNGVEVDREGYGYY